MSAQAALEEDLGSNHKLGSQQNVPQLTDVAAELLMELRQDEQMKQMEELLHTTEGREFLTRCAMDNNSQALQMEAKHAATKDEVHGLEGECKQLEEQLAAIPMAVERIRILQ